MEPLLELGEAGAEASRQAQAEAPPVSGVNRMVERAVPLYDARTILGQQGLDALPHDASAALLTIARWLDGYVSRPHPALGRTGEICPWTRRTIDLGSLLLTPIASDDQEEI